MTYARTRLYCIAAALLVPLALVTACATTAPPVEAQEEESVSETQPDTPITLIETAPVGAPSGAQGTFALTDDDGYTYNVSLWVAAGGTRTSVAEAKPGYVAVEVDQVAEITLTNTTAGRNAPVTALTSLSLAGVWPADSAICAAGASSFRSEDFQASPPSECRLDWGSFTRGDADTIADGASITTPISTTATFEIEESTVPAFTEQISRPAAWAALVNREMLVGTEWDCSAQSSMFYPAIVWASAPIGNCTIPSVGGAFSADVSPEASGAAASQITSLAATYEGGSTMELGDCPAGTTADLTLGIGGAPAGSTLTGQLDELEWPVKCMSNYMSLYFDPNPASNGPQQARANQYDTFTATPESNLYGGKLYAYCTGVDTACQAVWYDDHLVIRGVIGQYEGATEIEKLERLQRWFASAVPGMLIRLGS